MPDRTILAGAQDGIIRPDEKVELLGDKLKDGPLELMALPLPANFYDPGRPRLAIAKRPMNPGAKEGERIWKLQKQLERDPKIKKIAKSLNVEKFGQPTCEACLFAHPDRAMFDAHHPTPLAVGVRVTLPEHFEILCPTCHRRAHRKSMLDPFSLIEIKEWIAAGRP